MSAQANPTSTKQLPHFTEEEQKALHDYWDIYELHRDQITAELARTVGARPELQFLLRSDSPEEMAERQRVSRELQRRAFVEGDWEPYILDLQKQSANYAQAGFSLRIWFDILGDFKSAILPYLVNAYGRSKSRLLVALKGLDLQINVIMGVISESYLKVKQDIILQQQEAIRELSTPVLQLRDELLLLPLIGVLDSHRANQVTQHLLYAIRDRRASVAIMDITGVPTVDSAVANHLIQTVEAARLMGALVIITGLSADIAQTLVRIGVDFDKLNTKGDLQRGVNEAHRLLGYQTIRSGEPLIAESYSSED